MLKITLTSADSTPEPTGDMQVEVRPDGRVCIVASADDAATLAGRDGFGDLRERQAELRERIACAWYAADCPPATSRPKPRPSAPSKEFQMPSEVEVGQVWESKVTGQRYRIAGEPEGNNLPTILVDKHGGPLAGEPDLVTFHTSSFPGTNFRLVRDPNA